MVVGTTRVISLSLTLTSLTPAWSHPRAVHHRYQATNHTGRHFASHGACEFLRFIIDIITQEINLFVIL